MKNFKDYYEENYYLTESEVYILNESLKDFFNKSKRIENWVNRTLKTITTSKRHLDKNPPEGLIKDLEDAKKAYEQIRDLEEKLKAKKITRKEFKNFYKKISEENKDLLKTIKKSNVKSFLKNVGVPILSTAAFIGVGSLGLEGINRVLGTGAVIAGSSAARGSLDDTNKYINPEAMQS